MRLVDRLDRSLRAGVIRPERLDVVADELDADRMRRAGGVEVDDTAAGGELARLVGGILTRVAGVGKAIHEIGRRDLLVRPQDQSGRFQARRRAEPRKQRGRRGDDQPRRARAQPVERARARGGDVEVRRQAAIRIDLVRGKRDGLARGVGVREPFEDGEKEPRVGGELLHVRVGRRHEDDRPARCRGCREEGLRRGGQPADTPPRHPETEPGGGGLEQGAKRQRC
jgi:hypothetical protein